MLRGVKIRHPASGGVSVVPESSLGTWIGAGWVRDDSPPPAKAPPAIQPSQDQPPSGAPSSESEDGH
jgi:hypothetical protein